jgi:putative tryptophan/tyrosine transport system substrate-binding protein
MKRREFITLLGCAAAWPLAARAQQHVPIIGYLSSRAADTEAHLIAAFRRGLNETGYIEGRNVVVQFRWAQGQYDRLPKLASELVSQQVAVIFAASLPTAVAAKQANSTIPIVFISGGDPVQHGLVNSLNRPGGNVTGVGVFSTSLGPKRLQVLRELVPTAATIGFLVNPRGPDAEMQVREIEGAGRLMGQRIEVVNASTDSELSWAFEELRRRQAGALLMSADLLFQILREQLVALAANYAIPTMYEWREFVDGGGLVSYSTHRGEAYRQAGVYTGRIARGENPADLPVVQSIKFELVINLKTAKALGLELPPSLLARADEVIE